MKEQLEARISKVVEVLFAIKMSAELSRPEPSKGDYASNIAMKIAGQLNKSPQEVAKTIQTKLLDENSPDIRDVTIAEPGFVNIFLSDGLLLKSLVDVQDWKPKTYLDQIVVAEYSDPNPFKVLHAGHLYTSIVGDAVANLLEFAGATVHRVNFGGDIGLHVAKTMWAILVYSNDKKLPDDHLAWATVQGIENQSLSDKANWLAERYVEGNKAYEVGAAKQEIDTLNQKIYDLQSQKDKNSDLAKIYWVCREWSYEYFDEFYKSIGCFFERYYPESETADIGLKKANELLKSGILEKSEGAIVFSGEAYGLHTRVFITSKGLPTYETKEIGLQLAKWRDYQFDKSIIITGNDIIEYMKVVLKVVSLFDKKLSDRTTHLTHGIVKLKGGLKMSSRKGNILRATEVIEITAAANKALIGKENISTTLAAIKYAFLKQKISGDIIYDPAESISLEGNSGPYLQYAYARAKSILKKLDHKVNLAGFSKLDAEERKLVVKIQEFPEVISRATAELSPHYVCTYLYELAQVFNRFYENERIIDHEREAIRGSMVSSYANVLQAGFKVLNIPAPDHI
jgi:arginyl-tRNA synthetase